VQTCDGLCWSEATDKTIGNSHIALGDEVLQGEDGSAGKAIVQETAAFMRMRSAAEV
jgi:hypothetical protein